LHAHAWQPPVSMLTSCQRVDFPPRTPSIVPADQRVISVMIVVMLGTQMVFQYSALSLSQVMDQVSRIYSQR
ncbi:MAG: hypothetical protein O7G85_06195, partial [Planctomycetota bacterium]|nr:hypothetical protein [Planctomycetota bacterium]